MMEKIADVLDYVLEDDSSVEHGGVSFVGETVSDFLEFDASEDTDTNYEGMKLNDGLEKLNEELKSCGILPVF